MTSYHSAAVERLEGSTEAGVHEAAAELRATLGCDRLLSRLTGEVKRYHSWYVSREQTNADHTWHLIRIWIQMFGVPSALAMSVAMFHDVGEFISGDIPHPVKSFVPALKRACDAADDSALHAMGQDGVSTLALDLVSKYRLKFCDLLEMYEFGTRECVAGNVGTGRAVRRHILKALGKCRSANGNVGPITQDWSRVCAHVKAVDAWLNAEGATT